MFAVRSAARSMLLSSLVTLPQNIPITRWVHYGHENSCVKLKSSNKHFILLEIILFAQKGK